MILRRHGCRPRRAHLKPWLLLRGNGSNHRHSLLAESFSRLLDLLCCSANDNNERTFRESIRVIRNFNSFDRNVPNKIALHSAGRLFVFPDSFEPAASFLRRAFGRVLTRSPGIFFTRETVSYENRRGNNLRPLSFDSVVNPSCVNITLTVHTRQSIWNLSIAFLSR